MTELDRLRAALLRISEQPLTAPQMAAIAWKALNA